MNSIRNGHEITSATRLSFCLPSVLWQQLHSLLCVCCHALKTNKDPTPVAKLIPYPSLRHLLLLLNLLGLNAHAAGDMITISPIQLDNLGIKTGKLIVIKDVPLLYAPAKVTIPPAQEYIVSAAQAGLISKMFVSIGDPVTKNQALAQINSPELLSLQRQYLKAHSQLSLANANYMRDKKLYDEGVISARRWQETQTRHNGYISEVNVARQLLEITGMSSQKIKHLLNTQRLSSVMDVLAPIKGVVLERMAVAGTRIDILAPLYRIANIEQLWLEINIPQERINSIRQGDWVRIENTPVTATISLIAQNVNPDNQAVMARAVIAEPQTVVRVGQMVNAQIIRTSQKPVFKVSNSAIAQHQGHVYIFIRNQQGFTVQPITIIGKDGQHSMISGNLHTGDEIAITGAVALKAIWLGLGQDE